MKKLLFLAALIVATTFIACNDGKVRATSITLSSDFESMLLTDNLQLTAVVEPVAAQDQILSWESSDPAVADVDPQGNIIPKSYGTTTITVATEDGVRTDECEVSVNVIGKATFKTDNIWIVENDTLRQEWSDVVMAAGATGKTDYNGGIPDNFNADVRENAGYGDLFSYEAINLYGNIICPDGWRVPTSQDFISLDLVFGGEGINRWFEEGDNFVVNTFLNTQKWGGILGGGCDGSGNLTNQGLTGYYWSISTPDWSPDWAYPLAINPAMIYVEFALNKEEGYMVRCIR